MHACMAHPAPDAAAELAASRSRVVEHRVRVEDACFVFWVGHINSHPDTLGGNVSGVSVRWPTHPHTHGDAHSCRVQQHTITQTPTRSRLRIPRLHPPAVHETQGGTGAIMTGGIVGEGVRA